MQFRIGTSGYSYPKWKGSFYPEKLPQKEMLSYYAERFTTVEINGTFYKMPAKTDLISWAKQVPSGFRFTLKAPQVITHFKRLKDVAEPTRELFKIAAALKIRLGPILFGLHPNMKKDLPRLQEFVRLIPKPTKAAIEFRDASWFDDDVFDCLRKHRVALCIAEGEDLPKTPLVSTAGWGYVRLRRENYTKKSLAAWIEKIRSQSWKDAYVFFRHEETGTGPKFANQFIELATR